MLKNKVLILVENLSVPFDRRVWLEAVFLADAGLNVNVICPRFSGEKSFETLESVNIYRYSQPAVARGLWGYILEFLYCFIMTFILSVYVYFKDGFDIIHGCNPPDTFFAIGIIYKIFGKKFYYDQHDLCPELYLAKYGEHKKDGFYRALCLLEYLTYKIADKVIVTNNSYRDIALSRGRLNPAKVFIVRTGPDLKRFNIMPHTYKLIKRGEKKYIVSYLGVMSIQDGVDYLLRSIDIIVNKYRRRDVLFMIIGSGDSLASLKKMKDEFHLDGAVMFTGRIPDSEVFYYLSISDLCVAPDPKNALNDKSTMNKILEYMAFRRPIVCFDLKESRYTAGGAALYAVPNDVKNFSDKIIELLDNPELRKKMGRYGYERLKGELSWDYNRGVLLGVYENKD